MKYRARGLICKRLKGEPMAEKCTKEYTKTPAYDLISRQAVITEFSCCDLTPDGGIDANYAIDFLKHMPSAQPKLNKEKISDLLWNEYQEMSSHLSAEGVVARRYFCKELWKELFGEEETPVWMTW